MIIHSGCQVIGGKTVGFDQHLVIRLGSVHLYMSADHVVEGKTVIIRHL